jgi:hypothetical protein
MARRASYHHGDLRRALLSSAIELLATTSPGELSLREVARHAGVTTGAPYHHFQTKADLLVEVACAGFEELAGELARVDALPAPPPERLQKRIEAYMRFALAHGAHYRVMFAPELRASSELERYEAVARAGFDGLVRSVEAIRSDLRGKAARSLARTVWAAAHGFVMLALDGTVGALGDEASPSRIVRTTAAHLVAMVSAER